MKIVTLLENTACKDGLCAAHGLSLYIETPRHKILFDMGPNDGFLTNAKALGVDLAAVDTAVLSHGHYDHGGGLAAFCEANSRAEVLIHMDAFGDFYATNEGREPRYIGLDPELWQIESRVLPTGGLLRLDDELTLFADEGDAFPALAASAALQVRTEEGFRPDDFAHEQNLLIQAGGKAVLICGCAHRGVVNIRDRAAQLLGRMPDAVIGGFHFFELTPGPDADRLIDDTGRALLAGETVYYTGHCTGAYAYERLSAILGQRLRPLSGGAVVEI